MAWTTDSFALPGTISEMRGLLRAGFGSAVFSAVAARDVFVRLEAVIALRGEVCPQAGGGGWLATSCLCVMDLICVRVLLPEPPEKGQQEGVTSSELGSAQSWVSSHLIGWCICVYQHVTPDGPGRTETLGKI